MSKCGFFGRSGKRPVRDLVARGLSGFFVNGSASARPPASLLVAGVFVVALLAGAGTAGAQSFGSTSSITRLYTVGEEVRSSSPGNPLPVATGGSGTLNYALRGPGAATDLTLPNGLSYNAPNYQPSGDGTPPTNQGADPGGTITGTPSRIASSRPTRPPSPPSCPRPTRRRWRWWGAGRAAWRIRRTSPPPCARRWPRTTSPS